MLKVKEEVTKETLRNFGYKTRSPAIMEKSFGALTVYIDLGTRIITGCGFYPVGDRIVLEYIKPLIDKNLVAQEIAT